MMLATELNLLRVLRDLEMWKPKVEEVSKKQFPQFPQLPNLNSTQLNLTQLKKQTTYSQVVVVDAENGDGSDEKTATDVEIDAAINNNSNMLSTMQLQDSDSNQTLLHLPNITFPLDHFTAVVEVFEDVDRGQTTGKILTQRPDFLTDSLLRLYDVYIAGLISCIDATRTKSELNANVLSCAVRSLSVFNSLCTKLDVDDVLLRISSGLRLSLLLADFVEDKHQALSTLRATISYVDVVREELVSPSIHQPLYADDIAALARASVTVEVDDRSHMEAKKRLGGEWSGVQYLFWFYM